MHAAKIHKRKFQNNYISTKFAELSVAEIETINSKLI